MRIVGCMAPEAGLRRRRLPTRIRSVAAATSECLMRAGQRELCVTIVIEAPQGPTVGSVAVLARGP